MASSGRKDNEYNEVYDEDIMEWEWKETGPLIGKVVVWGNHKEGTGTVARSCPSKGRRPELFEWKSLDDNNDGDDNKRVRLLIHEQMNTADHLGRIPAFQERIESVIQHRAFRRLLPKCVLYALLEESWSVCLKEHRQQRQQQRQQQQQQQIHSEQKKPPPDASFFMPPHYSTPNTVSHENLDNDHDNYHSVEMLPVAMLQRIRAGAQLAFQKLEQQQLIHNNNNANNNNNADNNMSNSNARRLSSRRKTTPGPVAFSDKLNVWQRGGRVAQYLMEHVDIVLEDDDDDDDNHNNNNDNNNKPSREREPKGAKKSVTKRKRVKAKTSQASDDESEPEKKKVAKPKKAKKAAKRKPEPKTILIDAFAEAEAAGDDDDDNDADECDEDFEMDEDDSGVAQGKPRNRKPRRKRKGNDDNDKGIDEPDEEDDDKDMDEHECIIRNPYLKPTRESVLHWLGRQFKNLRLASLQEIIACCMENGESLSPNDLSMTDQHILGGTESVDMWTLESRTIKDEEKKTKKKKHTIVLRQDTNAVFAKCKFHLSSQHLIDKQLAQKRLAEQRHKQNKSWALWRFKGIHGGYTILPGWGEAVRRHYAPKQQPSSNDDDDDNNKEQITTSNNDKNDATATTDSAPDDLALAQTLSSSSRRSTRRANMTEAGVFYGAVQQRSQKQLMETIVRLCAKSTTQTIVSLQAVIADESPNPVQRMRTSLGRLVWKRHQLHRTLVNSSWSDEPLYRSVKEEPLCQPIIEEGDEQQQQQQQQLSRLAEYVQGLIQTEMQLRSMLLRHLTTTPIPIIATSADERQGSLENMDGGPFHDDDVHKKKKKLGSIEWEESGHEWIGELLYRPTVVAPTISSDHHMLEQCRWFKVAAYVPSIPLEGEAETPEQKNVNAVERRMRFRADPISNNNGEPLILTQGQVYAGMEAAKLEKASGRPAGSCHPFAGGMGTKVILRTSDSEITCTVAGHDTVTAPGTMNGQDDDDTKKETRQHFLLLLPVGTSSQDGFWTIVQTDYEGCMTCQTLDAEPITYKVDQSDYDSGSQAYQACLNVIEIMKKHKHAKVFLEPVDPVALNIPNYFSVVKHPMDISTLEENLEHGVYSKVVRRPGRSAVTRMLLGPFREDAIRIFDNAILFNPPDDWIHQAAVTMKKMVQKKIDQVVAEAEDGVPSLGSTNSGVSENKRSVYVDEDSDVDMYEYESDHDEDFETSSRRRKRRRSIKATKEDYSTLALESPIRLQHALTGVDGPTGPFARLPIVSDPAAFSLEREWTCRRRTTKRKHEEEQRKREIEEILSLQRQAEETETMGLRRSTRARDHREGDDAEDVVGASGSLDAGAEYVLTIARSLGDCASFLPETPCTRAEVEHTREHLHEYVYAEWYQRMWKRLGWSAAFAPLNGPAYANNGFPPYLGRVVPTSNDVVWEIRPCFVVPALRWVIRGLVHSGHLTALEPMETPQQHISLPQFGSGVILANNAYSLCSEPFEVAEVRATNKKKKDEEESEEEEVELSEYEKLRAERIARNAQRLKMLGLA